MNRWLSLTLILALLLLAAGPAPALAAPASDLVYVVQRGDTLFSIAQRFGVSVAAIVQANGLTNSNLIFVGQRLVIPTAPTGPAGGTSGDAASAGRCGRTYTVVRGDTLRIIADKCGTTAAAIIGVNNLPNPNLIFVGQVLAMPGSTSAGSAPPTPAATSTSAQSGGAPGQCGRTYTVVRGDTLRTIANKCGTTAAAIIGVNNLPNPNLIFVGQVLAMPGASTGPSVALPTASALPTAQPAATAAPPATASRGVTGQLTLCNPEKPSFAAKIERICFRETIFNTTGTPIPYSLLGVQATNLGGGPSQFQTSWRGDLSLPANGVGPAGGSWEDGIFIEVPGTYRLTLAICFANVDTCFLGTGWEVLTSGVNVTVVDWTP